MKLKRSLLAVILSIAIFAISISFSDIRTFAWDGETKNEYGDSHKDFMKQVLLWGTDNDYEYPTDVDRKREAEVIIQNLYDASYLAIDATGRGNAATKASDTKKFDALKKKCWRFSSPKTVVDIAIPSGSGTGGNGEHDKYTHLGWNHNYDNDHFPNWTTEQWLTRRNILLKTANKVLDFGAFSNKLWLDYDSQCEAFCELLYYIHILGDDISDFQKNNYLEYELPEDTMWFAGRKGFTDSSTDIAEELLRIMPELFPNHANDPAADASYKDLEERLKDIDDRANTLIDSEDYRTQSGYAELYELADTEMREALTDNIPILLRNEKFFSKYFYDD